MKGEIIKEAFEKEGEPDRVMTGIRMQRIWIRGAVSGARNRLAGMGRKEKKSKKIHKKKINRLRFSLIIVGKRRNKH